MELRRVWNTSRERYWTISYVRNQSSKWRASPVALISELHWRLHQHISTQCVSPPGESSLTMFSLVGDFSLASTKMEREVNVWAPSSWLCPALVCGSSFCKISSFRYNVVVYKFCAYRFLAIWKVTALTVNTPKSISFNAGEDRNSQGLTITWLSVCIMNTKCLCWVAITMSLGTVF